MEFLWIPKQQKANVCDKCNKSIDIVKYINHNFCLFCIEEQNMCCHCGSKTFDIIEIQISVYIMSRYQDLQTFIFKLCDECLYMINFKELNGSDFTYEDVLQNIHRQFDHDQIIINKRIIIYKLQQLINDYTSYISFLPKDILNIIIELL